MHRLRTNRRLPGWIAVLVILLAALAPVLPQAQGLDEAMAWREVCSVHGARRVPVDVEDPTGAPAATHAAGHCPCCLGHDPVLPAAPVSRFVAVVVARRIDLPPAFLSAPRTLHAWVSARPRAPPPSC